MGHNVLMYVYILDDHEFELYDPVKKNNEGWERPYKTNNI